MGKKTVLLADDHALIMEGIERVLADGDFVVVATCADGQAALDTLLHQSIDLAVLDLSMPRLDGLDVVAQARAEGCSTRFILLTMHADVAYLKRARRMGVLGYVLKDAAKDELLFALESATQGRTFTSASLIDKWSEAPPLDAPVERLTKSERAVMKELAQNKTSRQIASALGVSYRTVQNHRANICSKLELRGSNRLLEVALAHRDQW